MGNRSELDYIIAKFKKEAMYDTFLAAMKIIADGETFIKKVSKTGTGSGCIFVPRRYIHQEVRVIITPVRGEVIEANEALLKAEDKRLESNRALRVAKERIKELETGNTQATESVGTTESELEEEIEDVNIEDMDEDGY